MKQAGKETQMATEGGQELFDKGEEVETEESAMVGGPGDGATDTIVNPPEGEGPTREEGASPKEGEVTAEPKRRFKSWDDAEKAHAESEKRMSRATEEASHYRKLLSEGRTTEQPPTVRKEAWQRERETFEARKKAIPMPDVNDPEAVKAYNEKVADTYFQVHSEFLDIYQQEKVAAQQQTNQVIQFIDSEARKYGIDDTELEMRNPDGTVEKGSLANVFWSVCQNPGAFGINIMDASGRFLPLGDQVKVVAMAINRFVDALIAHRQGQGKRVAAEKRDLTVLRRGSSGPGRKGGEEEEDSITTFADGIKSNMANRRRAGSLRRRGNDD